MIKNISKLTVFGAVLSLMAACSDVTVPDLPDNFTGSYSGTVTAAGNTYPATLSLVQVAETTETDGTRVTTTKVSGSMSVNTVSGLTSSFTNPDCTYSMQLEQGSVTANSVTASGDEVTVSLTRNGSLLTGSVLFTGTAETFTDTGADSSTTCPKPDGAVSFTR